MPTFEVIKKELFSLFLPNRTPIFNICIPHLQPVFQLRMGLSHIRYQRYCHGFADRASGKCPYRNVGKLVIVEDNYDIYYVPTSLFSEILYFPRWDHLFIMNHTNHVDFLLYGHSLLNDSDNRSIILATLEFIPKPNGFHRTLVSSLPLPHEHCLLNCYPFNILVFCSVCKMNYIKVYFLSLLCLDANVSTYQVVMLGWRLT